MAYYVDSSLIEKDLAELEKSNYEQWRKISSAISYLEHSGLNLLQTAKMQPIKGK